MLLLASSKNFLENILTMESLGEQDQDQDEMRQITDQEQLSQIKRGLFTYYARAADDIRMRGRGPISERVDRPIELKKELRGREIMISLEEKRYEGESAIFAITLQRRGHEPVRIPGLLGDREFDRVEIRLLPNAMSITAKRYEPSNGNRFVNKVSAVEEEVDDYIVTEAGLDWLLSLPAFLYSV